MKRTKTTIEITPTVPKTGVIHANVPIKTNTTAAISTNIG